MARPRTYDLTSRYATVLAAGACLGVWWGNRDQRDPFLRDPHWILAALIRLGSGAGPGKDAPPLPEKIEAALFAQLLDRYQNGNTFDLANRHLPEWNEFPERSMLKERTQ